MDAAFLASDSGSPPERRKGTERIDGSVALIMAIGRAMVVQVAPQPSYQMFVL
jgi:hypothetical protein